MSPGERSIRAWPAETLRDRPRESGHVWHDCHSVSHSVPANRCGRSVLRSSCWLSKYARCTVLVGVSRLVVAKRLKRRAIAHQILLLMDTLRVLGCAL